MIPPSAIRLLLCGLGALLGAVWFGRAEDIDRRVLDAETQRVAVVAKVQPSVVAVFSPNGEGGGSGVLISQDGYALTNFHVVEGSGPLMQCGLPDGVLYDAALVGIDKVGDVALIKLLPQKPGQIFPYAPLGDSDKSKAGDLSLAMGNPFLLATDFRPTVTFGLISGVHRYQYPSGTLLEYTDCIQIETSINPGNSGGPLFNMDGELIGINGRGSFEKRGRVNSGAGYAISINQIKNFMGHLRAGLDTDHATLGATVKSASEEDSDYRMVIDAIIEDCDAHRRGLDAEDELVSFAGRPITSVNQYKNVLGLFPKGWRVPLVYRRKNEKHEILVRLMQLQQTPQTQDEAKPKPRPAPPRPRTPARKSPASEFYEPKPGYANFYFNKVERDRLLAGFRSHGDFTNVAGDWIIEATGETKLRKDTELQLVVREEIGDKAGTQERAYHLDPETLPRLPAADPEESKNPFRRAVRHADRLLRVHAQSFPQEFWAQGGDDQVKERVIETQKDVAIIQTRLMEALEDLKKAQPERAKETVRQWQAHYDYLQARLSGFCTYVYEYNLMLAQLRKDPPKLDAKVHRGWRMEPAEKVQDGEAKKLAAETRKLWTEMTTHYKDTRWEEPARQGSQVQLGLKWVPTGGTKTMVRLTLGSVKYDLDPLKTDQEISVLEDPPGSGGLLTALYQYRRLLTLARAEAFEGHFSHGGYEPYYPPPRDEKQSPNYKDWRVDAEVLVTEHGAVPAKWYFSKADQTLLGFEVSIEKEKDPCEVYLSDYRTIDGRSLPHRIEVRYGNERFGVFAIKKYQLAAAK